METCRKELEFILELARVGLSKTDTIYRISAKLEMDPIPLDKLCEDHKDNIETVGKQFMLRWRREKSEDPNKFHKLWDAFEKVGSAGDFESVQRSLNFRIPEYQHYDQLELADGERLDDKLNKFLGEVPGQICTRNILVDVGIYSGCSMEEIEAIKEDNPRNINQAGRQLIQHILKKKKGPLRKKVLDLQTAFRKSRKLTTFNQLLLEHDITDEELTSLDEYEDLTGVGLSVSNIRTPASPSVRPSAGSASPAALFQQQDSLRHFDSILLPPDVANSSSASSAPAPAPMRPPTLDPPHYGSLRHMDSLLHSTQRMSGSGSIGPNAHTQSFAGLQQAVSSPPTETEATRLPMNLDDIAHEIEREGQFDFILAYQEATKVVRPSVEAVRERLQKLHLGDRRIESADTHVKHPEQIGLGMSESGYQTLNYAMAASNDVGQPAIGSY